MPELDLTALRNIAAAAGPDPWWGMNRRIGVDEAGMPRWVTGRVYDTADAAHIAAFDPPTALALLDRIDDLGDNLNIAMQEHAHGQERAEKAEHTIYELRESCGYWRGRVYEISEKHSDHYQRTQRELAELRAGQGKWKGTTDA